MVAVAGRLPVVYACRMRYVLALAALFLVGCRLETRTVAIAPPVAANSAKTPPLVSPVYPDARPVVYLACERAALAYFKHIDEQDEAAGRIFVHDKNGWSGHSDVEITLVAIDGGTRVDVHALRIFGSLITNRPRQVTKRYLETLAIEIRTVRGIVNLSSPPASHPADPVRRSDPAR